MILYIYRLGWTYPKKNLLQDLNLLKSLVILGFHLDRSDRSTLPVRPVDPTGQTGRLLPDRLQRLTSQTARAYRSVLSNANFGRQHVYLLYGLKQAPGTSGYRLILVSLGS